MSDENANQTRQRLKIAIVLNRFYPEVGGAETNLYFQAAELSKHHDVTVFTPRRRQDTPAREKISGFKVFRLFDWFNLSGKYPNLRRDTFIPQIFIHILFKKFDVIQVFPSLNHNNMAAMLAAKLRRRPFILCSFDLLDYAMIEKQNGRIDPECLNSYVPSRVRRFLFGQCSHIFAISEREITFYRRYNANVSFSPVPAQPEEFMESNSVNIRKKYKINPETMIFLVLGRLSSIKGQDLATSAFCEISEKIPDSIMFLVGRNDYEPDFLNRIKAQIIEHKLEHRIICTGMVERSEVLSFLRQSDIQIVPVRFMNSGAVVVESWAAGIPVIQSDAVDPNLVEPGKNGYLFHSKDIQDLASCMMKAYAEREKLPELGKRGREMVLKRFTYPRLIRIYNDIYRKLTDKPGRNP
ncbi:MAG: glycosyltransferase family 4 protein [Victivallaceae bacterium]|nr:glycosyltransferase family 4 protein [Victivallaceae bacterium]